MGFAGRWAIVPSMVALIAGNVTVDEQGHMKTKIRAEGEHALRDYRINWRQTKAAFFPDFALLSRVGVDPVDDRYSIFIEDGTADMNEVRDWLDHNCSRRGYTMFGRYEACRQQFKTLKAKHGYRFAFADYRDAIYFKLRWG